MRDGVLGGFRLPPLAPVVVGVVAIDVAVVVGGVVVVEPPMTPPPLLAAVEPTTTIPESFC